MALNVIFGTKQQKILVIIIKNVFFCIKPQEEDREKNVLFFPMARPGWGSKNVKKGAAYAAPFLYPTCRLFFVRSRMEGTAATGGAVAATRSNPTFMVMHDGVHRNKDEQEDNKSYDERSHKDQLLCFTLQFLLNCFTYYTPN